MLCYVSVHRNVELPVPGGTESMRVTRYVSRDGHCRVTRDPGCCLSYDHAQRVIKEWEAAGWLAGISLWPKG